MPGCRTCTLRQLSSTRLPCCHLVATRRLHLYGCIDDVHMLTGLSQLSALLLGMHSCSGSELDSHNYPNTDNWLHLLSLPPLGGVTSLTELCLAGLATLPPDFRQLSHLRHLTVAGVCGVEGPLEWGNAPLASLTSLTRLDAFQYYEWLPGEKVERHVQLLPGGCRALMHVATAIGPTPADPAVLASAPRLAEVHVEDCSYAWRAQLRALRPDVTITIGI